MKEVRGYSQVFLSIFQGSDVINVLRRNGDKGKVQSVGILCGNFTASAFGEVFAVFLSYSASTDAASWTLRPFSQRVPEKTHGMTSAGLCQLSAAL